MIIIWITTGIFETITNDDNFNWLAYALETTVRRGKDMQIKVQKQKNGFSNDVTLLDPWLLDKVFEDENTIALIVILCKLV